MIIEGLGIPYMGSKRKLAPQIINAILKDNPDVKYLWDLFGGGGAISFYALQRREFKKVYYNELDTAVCELIKDIRLNGITPKYYQWIDRDIFHKHKNDNDWFGGLVKTCWSFGNNQKSYLFSEENERMKKPLHFAIVENNPKYFNDFKEISGIKVPAEMLQAETINDRRLKAMDFIKKAIKGRMELQQLQRLQQLERLEQLQQLERLEQLQQLEIINKSYIDVEITTPESETVIYLDPPYQGTEQYQCCVDCDELWKYFHSSGFKIYLSSYKFDGEEVDFHDHRCTMSAMANNKVIEKLYCNKPSGKVLTPKQTDLF